MKRVTQLYSIQYKGLHLLALGLNGVYITSHTPLCLQCFCAWVSLAIVQRYLTGHCSEGSEGRSFTGISAIFKYIDEVEPELGHLASQKTNAVP